MAPAEPAPTATPARGIRRIRVPQKLRNLELFLLLFVCAVNAFSVVLVQFGALGYADMTTFSLGAGLAVLVLGLHVALRFVATNADPFILPIAALLNGIGIAMIYRIDIAEKLTGWESTAVRQVVWSGVAIALALVVILVIRNHRVLQRYTYVAMLVAAILLLLPMLPVIGQEIN
ncbi:MAG: cell division protein FtsW, partial [Herbiconiux sp.]|nr:cell division protein FtsW [Herbiconiux sp.]